MGGEEDVVDETLNLAAGFEIRAGVLPLEEEEGARVQEREVPGGRSRDSVGRGCAWFESLRVHSLSYDTPETAN